MPSPRQGLEVRRTAAAAAIGNVLDEVDGEAGDSVITVTEKVIEAEDLAQHPQPQARLPQLRDERVEHRHVLDAVARPCSRSVVEALAVVHRLPAHEGVEIRLRLERVSCHERSRKSADAHDGRAARPSHSARSSNAVLSRALAPPRTRRGRRARR